MPELIRGNIISADGLDALRCIPEGYIAVDNGVISGVYETLPEEYEGLPITDYGDRLILQSFADMHLHGPQFPMLGTGIDLPLMEWLKEYAFPTERGFSDPAYARRVYHQLAKELLDRGTTRVVMFSSLHTDATLILMEELEQAGICGYVGKVNMDQNGGEGLQETTEESCRETLRWLDQCDRFHKIRPILTPRFIPSCTPELLEWLGQTAQERGLYVHSHISENTGEIAFVKELHPDCARYWESYAKYGLWKDHTVMAHCVYSDEVERKAIKDAHVLVVHCPDSNLNICSGIAPVRTMLDEGLWVALGSDIAGGTRLSMLEVMGIAIQSSKARSIFCGDRPLNAAEAYYLATSAGHSYFGDAPGFAVGNPFHAIVLDDSSMNMCGTKTLPQRLERAVYRGDRFTISAVYADGVKVRG